MQPQRAKLRDYSERVVAARQLGVAFGDGLVAPDRRRGRGAASNESGRFEPTRREEFDDGWGTDETLKPFKTEVIHERPRTIIARNESPDVSFDRSINPYRGCEHGCVYCFARPTHAYVGLSPGLDFESKLFVKDGAAALLERELAAPNYRPRTIALGTNTDPYQPIERQYRVTRSVLEVLARYDHPVGIVTKSNLVLRDLDILSAMAAKGLVKVYVSVTTLDKEIARKMEPRAPIPGRRLEAIESLAEAGVPVGVMVAPIVPAVNDAEIETILTRAHAAGAREAGYVMLRLPLELRDIFREWLLVHYPDKLRHSLSLVQSTRGGKDYDSQWGKRMAGSGPYAWMIGRRFEIAATRLGYNENPALLRCDLFHKPEGEAKGPKQLSLF
jgi:DNA repair photolyase